jgi:hypothetical protein
LDKYRFMSPGWIEMARAQITRVLTGENLAGIDFTLCEEFTSPPDDLRRDNAPSIGFFVRIANGLVEVGDHPLEDADFKVVSEYEDALAIARDPDAPAAQQSAMAERMAEGRLRLMGDPASVPAMLAELDIHRLLSSRTL